MGLRKFIQVVGYGFGIVIVIFFSGLNFPIPARFASLDFEPGIFKRHWFNLMTIIK
jgi:hypothetical protein